LRGVRTPAHLPAAVINLRPVGVLETDDEGGGDDQTDAVIESRYLRTGPKQRIETKALLAAVEEVRAKVKVSHEAAAPLSLDLDTLNVVGNEALIVNRLRWLEMVPNRSSHQRLDVGCRDPAYRSGALRLALEQGGRQIVPILDASFADVARRHAIAAVIENAAANKASDLVLAIS
jgi:hypothetical protein